MCALGVAKGVDNGSDGSPGVLAGGTFEWRQGELAAGLPPDDQLAFAWCECSVDDGDVTVEYTPAAPTVTADAEKICAAGVSDKQLVEAERRALALSGRIWEAGVYGY